MAFLKKISENMNELRKSQEFTDVSLKIGDEIHAVHKVQLAAASPVLKALFSENWQHEGVPELSSENVYPEIGGILIEYIYTGEITIDEENASSLLVAAHYLQMDELMDMSEQFIIGTVTLENAFYLFRVAYRYDRKALMAKCIEQVELDYQQVFKDKSTTDFAPDEMLKLLENLRSKDKIEGLKEFLYGRVIEWAKVDVEKRVGELPALLGNIPMNGLKSEFLKDTVAKEELVRGLPDCTDILFAALCEALQMKQ